MSALGILRRGLVIPVAALVALAPLLDVFAVNPPTRYFNDPCGSWQAESGATGTVVGHPYSATFGCYGQALYDVGFRGSDYQTYWYYGGWEYQGDYFIGIHFCEGWQTGSGTCWWADTASGEHQVEEWPQIYSAIEYTWATCSGC